MFMEYAFKHIFVICEDEFCKCKYWRVQKLSAAMLMMVVFYKIPVVGKAKISLCSRLHRIARLKCLLA